MGGNYFKLGRLPRSRYLAIEADLRAYLDGRFGSDLYRIPRYYGAKPDFGDVDILLSTDVIRCDGNGDWKVMKHDMMVSLGVETYESNGAALTAVYQSFQVDFFLVSPDELESKSNFMAFNDLGHIIGRLFRPFNLKYGEKGLFYVFRRDDGSKYKRDIFVSRDWERILGFVGLDHAAWVSGFHDLEEMFDWVLESPYFRSSSFVDPRSPMVRTRSKQRTTIRRFMEYLEERGAVNRTFPESETLHGQDAYVSRIEAHFPDLDLSHAVEEERRKESEAISINSKFNGRLVMEWLPELKGKALGRFMNEFRAEVPELMSMSAEEVEEEARRRYRRNDAGKTPQLL